MKTPTSIARLGEAMQMAYVPADLDAALHFWTKTIGAGPFFAINHIELVRQHNDAPSIFKAWRDEGREGLHHVCMLVDDMDTARSICATAGATILQEALVPNGGEVIY